MKVNGISRKNILAYKTQIKQGILYSIQRSNIYVYIIIIIIPAMLIQNLALGRYATK